ncbi:FG-GAP-like repeat-containing protein [Monashia sp. NPDC004114]
MFTYARARARLAVLLTLGLAATTVALAAPAASAADVAPRLDSISFTSPAAVTPGDAVTISYSATASTTVSIVASFVDAAGRRTEWDFGRELPLTGQASTAVPDGLANVSTKLTVLTITDASGNRTTYWPSSMTCVPECPGAVHGLSFDVSLAITGSTPDNDTPFVTSIALATPTALVGESVRLDLGVDEAHPPVVFPESSASAVFTNGRYGFQLRGLPTAYGSLVGVVPSTVPDGSYWLESVVIQDLPGNSATYRDTGSVVLSPPGSVGPTTHTLPFKTTTVTVTGSPLDLSSPVLSSIAVPKKLLVSGAAATIAYEVSEPDLDSITIRYDSSASWQSPFAWDLVAKPTSTGVASGVVPQVSTGRWTVGEVTLIDKAGNYSVYQRGGALHCNRTCPSTHTFDLAALDVDVAAAPTAPSYAGAIPHSGSARVEWNPPDDLGNSPLTGYAITVSPGGKSYTASAGAMTITIPGLTNNTAYSFSVRARNGVGLGPARVAKATPRAVQRLFITGDVSNDGRADIVGVTRSNVAYIYRGNGVGGISGGTKVRSGLGELRALLPALAKPTEDFFGGNVLSVSYTGWDESWWAYNGNRLIGMNSILPSKFNTYRHIVTPGDFNGNAKADVLTITDAGDMYLWSNKDWTHFYAPKKIGSGWQTFSSVVGVGDLDADRRNDLVARKTDGTLWLYAGNGAGGFRYRKQIGTSKGWNAFTQLAGMGDFTGDRRNDLLALAPNGYLYVYKGNGTGGLSTRVLVSRGFGSFV